MKKVLLTVEHAKKDIEFAISQIVNHRSAETILNETYPWTTGMTLTNCEAWTDSEGKLRTSPKFNIDWDTRSDFSGKIVAMGSIDFDTVEEGAKKLSEAINADVREEFWSSQEEQAKLDAEIKANFQKFFDKHCGDGGDCPLRPTCEVKWPGGFGLQGCRADGAIREEIRAYI